MVPVPIRVLLANLPVVLSELLTQELLQQESIQVIGRAQGNINILLQAQAGVDIIIIGAPQIKPPPGICSHLLNEFPHVRLLVYGIEQNALVGYYMGARRCRTQHLTPSTLVDSIQTLFGYTVTL